MAISLYFPFSLVVAYSGGVEHVEIKPAPDEEGKLHCGACGVKAAKPELFAHQCRINRAFHENNPKNIKEIGVICRRCFNTQNTFDCCLKEREIRVINQAWELVEDARFYLPVELLRDYFRNVGHLEGADLAIKTLQRFGRPVDETLESKITKQGVNGAFIEMLSRWGFYSEASAKRLVPFLDWESFTEQQRDFLSMPSKRHEDLVLKIIKAMVDA